ncbi:hypothetical protein AOL_s00075g145 [Orbilia oligospora ATCC 24927]|uniref:Uncharacterized protein n=1 Tax=Arthrobotrys oligospora (strain ATCC 24927 / CBS 115.81 / DSM 1491) TaxID=756982 RepID=G1X8E6_ARTOA|nr:hypothetical protein AOL_s00075g145 [Orbilia oligospora ATCC 24927]EGX50719.1 hypothetical protein AOL_s00075g145 [Orbilia oligospora ATCC 24927]
MAPLGQFFALAANSPFYGHALEELQSNDGIIAALKILKPWPAYPAEGDGGESGFRLPFETPGDWIRDHQSEATTVDQKPCSSPVRSYEKAMEYLRAYRLFKSPSQKTIKKYRRGSKCRRRDTLLAIILDAFATNLESLDDFENAQQNPDIEHYCREKGFWDRYIVGLITAISSGTGKSPFYDCGTEVVEKHVSDERYTEAIENLGKNMATMYNVIDAWVCKHSMTDKSMTYFTLFSRKIEDSGLEVHRNDKDLRAVHFLDDYPKASIVQSHSVSTWYKKALDSALKKYTKDVGETATKLMSDLKSRAEFTKNLMETLGKAEKTQEETEKISSYCDTLKGVVPDDEPLPAETKKESKS